MHKDLIFDTPGGIGCQFDILIPAVGTHGLDQTDRSYRDQVLQIDPGVLKAAGNKYHQPQISLDQQLLGLLVAFDEACKYSLLIGSLQGRRQNIRATDIMDGITGNQSQLHEKCQQFTFHATPPVNAS